MAQHDTNHNFRVSLALRERFYTKCGKDNETPSAVLRRLMSDYATGRIQYGQPLPKTRG